MKYLIYINAEVGSVFRSQVAELLFYYEQNNIFRGIYLLCGVRNNNEKEKVSDIFKNSSIKIIFFKTYPNYFIFNKQQSNELRHKLKQVSAPADYSLIHIRGELLSMHCISGIKSQFGSLRQTLVDIRGAGWEETLEFQGGNTFKNQIKLINYKHAFNSLKQFGAISAVSKSLKEYIALRAPGLSSPIHVVPCLVSSSMKYDSSKRKNIREKLNLGEKEKVLIFSSGGNAAWQQMKDLAQIVSKKWKIINLSPTPMKQEGILNDFVSHEKVSDYLSAADAAVIFRAKSIVNKVACPVKFCEYLCSGLPVVADSQVDMISEYIERTGHGVVLEEASGIHHLPESMIFPDKRNEIQDEAISVFGINNVAANYLDIYKGLI